MAIKKKSKETLDQQKNSFLNFVGTQKKYESIIAELFLMDNEKIGDINYVKSYLKWKWIDKVLVDNFENDYKKYLWGNYFYWPINQYSPELQNKIIENNKKLKKLKREIIKEYNEINDFDLIVSNKKFEGFLVDEIWCEESVFNSRNIDDDISNIEKKVKDKNDSLELAKENLEQKEKEYAESNFLSFVKKSKLKKEIKTLRDNITKLEDELSNLKSEKDELNNVRDLLNWIKSYKQYCRTSLSFRSPYAKYQDWWDPLFEFIWIEKWSLSKVFDESFEFSENGKNNYKDYCKDYLSKIVWKLKLCAHYMSNEDFYRYIIQQLSQKRKLHTIYDGPVKDYIKSLENKINEYLNYFFFWEDKKLNCIWWHQVPTVFSWEKMDENILNIINIIKDFNTDLNLNFDGIDERFMDDLFIHKSDFRVLDEILKEWGLISHNEILNRSYNQDIRQSMMNHGAQHKDVYFSRWFNQHWYWLSQRLEDKVFYINTMNNFALNGYWVPLNLTMQNNTTIEDNSYGPCGDSVGFSIISKNCLGWNNHSKVDVKDLFIFVSETKKAIIEWNPKDYPVDNAHIIYIPKEYYSTPEFTYKIYEFIEKQMEQYKQNKKIVPNKIIWNKEDNIWSCWNDYLWTFCTELWDDAEKNIPNLLWDWNIDNIINLLKNCSKKENKMFVEQIEEWLKNVNFEGLSLPSFLPFELFKLIYAYLKVDYNHRPYIWSITRILARSWYSQKEIAIFYEIIYFINASYTKNYVDLQHFCNAFSLDYKDIESIIKLLWQMFWFNSVYRWLIECKEVYSQYYQK